MEEESVEKTQSMEPPKVIRTLSSRLSKKASLSLETEEDQASDFVSTRPSLRPTPNSLESLHARYFAAHEDDDATDDCILDLASVDYAALPLAPLATDASRPEKADSNDPKALDEYLRNRGMPLYHGAVPHSYCGHEFTSTPAISDIRAMLSVDQKIALEATRDAIGPDAMKFASFRFSQSPVPSAKVAFVPPGKSLGQEKVLELVKKTWGLEPPNLLLSLDIGSRHPSCLATDILVQAMRDQGVAEIDSLLADLQQAVDQKLHSNIKACMTEDLSAAIFFKLSQHVAAVLDSAAMTNNWIVIDRTSATKSSPTAELLIEMAAARCERLPVILVLESLDRYATFRPNRQVNRSLMLLGRLAAAASVEPQPGVSEELPSMYVPQDFADWRKYAFIGADFPDQAVPLPREPEKLMVPVDSEGRMMMTADGRPDISPELKWLYHYRQHTFTSGTHYVVLGSSTSSFPYSSLGGEGKVFAHGGNLAFPRMSEWIRRGKPMAMVFNSGGVAQAFAALHTSVVKRHATNSEALQEMMSQVTSTEPWAQKIGMTEVMMMRELNTRAPVLLRKSVVVVDAVRDDPEQVVKLLSSCFASSAELPELGLGSAEADVVLSAWKLEVCLAHNAKRTRFWADLLYFCSLVLSLVSSVLAICLGSIFTKEDDREISSTVSTSMIVLPLLSGVLGAIISKMRLIPKWGALRLAQAQIVREIYKFRMRVAEYDGLPLAAGEEDERNSNANRGSRIKQAPRKIFAQRIQSIFADVMESDVREAGVEEPSLRLKVNDVDAAVHEEAKLLRKKISKQLQGEGFPQLNAAGSDENDGAMFSDVVMPSGAQSPQAKEKPKHLDANMIEADDHVGPINVETYVTYRMKPLLTQLQRQTPGTARALHTLEMFGFCVTASGTLLATLGFTPWVALTVAVYTVVGNIIQYYMFPSVLIAKNSAIKDIRSTCLWWDSLSVVERRTRSSKARVVMVTEDAALRVVSALSATLPSTTDSPQEGDEAEDEKKKKKSS